MPFRALSSSSVLTPPPKLRVFPFVWPGIAPSYNFGGIPKEDGGGGLRKRMLEEREAMVKD